MRRRRRDLLEDTVIAFAVTISALVFTAGLGVIALLEVPAAAVVVGTLLIGRRRRKRHAQRATAAKKSRLYGTRN
jgi:hypothetical protein